MAKRDERLTASDTMAECARLGVRLARGPDGNLYLWSECIDDPEDRLSDRLFGAIIRNQGALLRMVPYMDGTRAADMGPELFHFRREYQNDG